jgi:hypothetical protein
MSTKSNKIVDAKFWGAEPNLSGEYEQIDLVKAYNWYNAIFDSADSKKFTIEYLKSIKFDKDNVDQLSSVDPWYSLNVGWNCRILSNGGHLSSDILDRMWQKINNLASAAKAKAQKELSLEKQKSETKPRDTSLEKTYDIITDLENELDRLYAESNNNKIIFKASEWFKTRGVKPAQAKHISRYFEPIYEEFLGAIEGKDAQLKEGYSRWKKPTLRSHLEILSDIIAQSETIKIVRKPRKKKVKPPAQIVKSLKYKVSDDEYKLTSIKPTDIVGCNQLWVFNSKYRTLAVYNASEKSGLTIKGTSLLGFDEKTSVTKKLRKPKEQIQSLLDSGKVSLRKYMSDIKSVAKLATGRINNDVILLRVT